jgi:aminopeptidase N
MMPAMPRPAYLALVVILAAGAWRCSDRREMTHARDTRPPAVDAGVPLTLAGARAARVSRLRYDLRFIVPEAVGRPVSGTATLRFELSDPSGPLALDFAGPALRSVQAQGRIIEAGVENEHVVLPPSALRRGENEIRLSFDASDLALNRNPDFMYTLFVPARARLAFPCFDQPDLKARYTLALEVPRGWEAISNSPVRGRTERSEGVELEFGETHPIPAYLFAFAAGRFQVESAERNGRTLRMLHRETDAAKVARNVGAVFDLHGSALDWLERYTAVPFPFEKFDFVLLPAFQFGGMEHPGSIFYNASFLLLDPSATQDQQIRRASLIAHETAHMWFGDLVTMRWFDDVWMKEVFANFMAAKIVNPSFPRVNHDLRFLFSHYPGAYDVDRTAGTNAIRQRLDNLNEAGGLYGAIIYLKAPIVMRQLEMIVGEEGLRDGLREYLASHAYGNAGWPDLVALLDRRTPEDLDAWSRAWVDDPGRPVITTSEVRHDEDTLHLRFVQADPRRGGNLKWMQKLRITLGTRDGERHVDAKAGAAAFSASAPMSSPPLYVLPTGGGIGYGEFALDAASRGYLVTHLADVTDALTRGAALVTLWEEMLSGRLTAPALFRAVTAALPRERDELNVTRMLACTRQLFWKFLPPAERDARSAALERALRAGLAAAGTPGLKSAWFNALRDVAVTRPTLVWLERVWRGTERVPGLTLAEPDYITLALELAVREGPSWKDILLQQHGRIKNPDRKAQFEFVTPALSADPAARSAFFAGLADVKNRRHEAWVLQALAYLHHPLRAQASETHISASLELLREIQRTGDIFFPKRWADATLSGHRSPSAARLVRTFLDGLPEDYPERLRRIVLSSADDLFRASRSPER